MFNKQFHDLNPIEFAYTIRPHIENHKYCYPFDNLYYNLCDNLELKIDGKTIKYPRATLIYIPANKQFVINGLPGIAGDTLFRIGFNGVLSNKFSAFTPPSKYTYEGSIFHEMKNAQRLKNSREEYLIGQLFKLLSETEERFSETSNDYVLFAKDYIHKNYANDITTSDIANILNIDKRYFSKIFKKAEGITPSFYLTKVRMGHALELLQLNYSVSETAQKCGYNSPYYFSRQFSKYYLVPPSSFKESQKKESE